MNNRSRSGLMVIAGGYLAYMGFELVRDTLLGKEGSSNWFLGVGIAFLIIGVGSAVWNIKNLIKARTEMQSMEETSEGLLEDVQVELDQELEDQPEDQRTETDSQQEE